MALPIPLTDETASADPAAGVGMGAGSTSCEECGLGTTVRAAHARRPWPGGLKTGGERPPLGGAIGVG